MLENAAEPQAPSNLPERDFFDNYYESYAPTPNLSINTFDEIIIIIIEHMEELIPP